MSNTHGEWLDRIKGNKPLKHGTEGAVERIKILQGWLADSPLKEALDMAIEALSEYTERKTVKKVVSRGGITMEFSSACANTIPGAEGGCWMSDTISRREAIDAVHKAIFGFFDKCDDDEETPMTCLDKKLLEVNKAITTRLKDLPTAEKTGKWIYSTEGTFGDPYGSYKCSVCGAIKPWRESYCAGCGAKMEDNDAPD